MEPIEGTGAIFNAVAGGGVVSHDFGGAVVSGDVDLGKKDAAIGGGLEAVGLDEPEELTG